MKDQNIKYVVMHGRNPFYLGYHVTERYKMFGYTYDEVFSFYNLMLMLL
jgi:hypothetical protein